MLSWQVGRVKVTRVVEIEFNTRYRAEAPFIAEATPDALKATPWLYPHFVRPEDGALKVSIHALLVEAPSLRLVVDTCVGNDKPRGLVGGKPLATGFLAELAKAGWTREGVDMVVCTHLHVDHVGWNTMLVGGQWVPTFPNARYLIGRQEYEHWRGEADGEAPAILADSVKPIFDAGLAELVEMDHRISPEIRLTPTTGHTPGHVSVMIESEGQRAMITGDIMHHPCQIAHPEWAPGFDSDKQAAVATRRKVLAEVADQPILVIGTHFAAPTAGHIRRDGAGFLMETEHVHAEP
ncbi:MAG TPA: MBL fold metallo-hydrolase [Caulobacteraceae bacterium]|jgi:glyoxylase-like metal-dependent hydrolase (beta-lactamase superfamily II)